MDTLQTFGSVTSTKSGNLKNGTLHDNIRMIQPEIQPLQKKKELNDCLSESIVVVCENKVVVERRKIHLITQVSVIV